MKPTPMTPQPTAKQRFFDLLRAEAARLKTASPKLRRRRPSNIIQFPTRKDPRRWM